MTADDVKVLEKLFQLCADYDVSEAEFFHDSPVARVRFGNSVNFAAPEIVPAEDEGDEQGDEGYNRALDRMSGKTGEKP